MLYQSEMLVIGGGPAGCAAALNAHDLGLDILIMESRSIGGQLWFVDHIANLPIGPSTGPELAQMMAAKIEEYGIKVIPARAIDVRRISDHWQVCCENGDTVDTKVIVAATGSRELRLCEHGLIGEVSPSHKDSYIFDIAGNQFLSEEIVLIGCDREIFSLLKNADRNARITVLALPDKWYVIKDHIGRFPFPVIPVSRVRAVGEGPRIVVDALTLNGENLKVECDLILTNLGKRPASELFIHLLPHDPEHYLTPKDYIGNVEGLSIYPVGDVAHKSFQRISVAIGDGASAALDYFYGREGLYRSRQSIRELKISTQVV